MFIVSACFVCIACYLFYTQMQQVCLFLFYCISQTLQVDDAVSLFIVKRSIHLHHEIR